MEALLHHNSYNNVASHLQRVLPWTTEKNGGGGYTSRGSLHKQILQSLGSWIKERLHLDEECVPLQAELSLWVSHVVYGQNSSVALAQCSWAQSWKKNNDKNTIIHFYQIELSERFRTKNISKRKIILYLLHGTASWTSPENMWDCNTNILPEYSVPGILCATTQSTLLPKVSEKTCYKIRRCYSFTVMCLDRRYQSVCNIQKSLCISNLFSWFLYWNVISKKREGKIKTPKLRFLL